MRANNASDNQPISAKGARLAHVVGPNTQKDPAVTYSCSHGDHVQTSSALASLFRPNNVIRFTPSDVLGTPLCKTPLARIAVSASSPQSSRHPVWRRLFPQSFRFLFGTKTHRGDCTPNAEALGCFQMSLWDNNSRPCCGMWTAANPSGIGLKSALRRNHRAIATR